MAPHEASAQKPRRLFPVGWRQARHASRQESRSGPPYLTPPCPETECPQRDEAATVDERVRAGPATSGKLGPRSPPGPRRSGAHLQLVCPPGTSPGADQCPRNPALHPRPAHGVPKLRHAPSASSTPGQPAALCSPPPSTATGTSPRPPSSSRRAPTEAGTWRPLAHIKDGETGPGHPLAQLLPAPLLRAARRLGKYPAGPYCWRATCAPPMSPRPTCNYGAARTTARTGRI